jgi:MFS superfamily sulfate permease-like transporter
LAFNIDILHKRSSGCKIELKLLRLSEISPLTKLHNNLSTPSNLMQTVKQFIKIIDYHTLLVAGLSMAVVYICRRLEYLVDLPTTLIGIAVVFPLVFSINSAYKQREHALWEYASVKALGI